MTGTEDDNELPGEKPFGLPGRRLLREIPRLTGASLRVPGFLSARRRLGVRPCSTCRRHLRVGYSRWFDPSDQSQLTRGWADFPDLVVQPQGRRRLCTTAPARIVN